MDAQLQIRQNALEAQDYMRDLLDWQKTLKEKAGSKTGQTAADRDVPAVRGRAPGSVQAAPEGMQQPAVQPGSSNAPRSAAPPASHTYTHYSKWDRFDVDAALEENELPNKRPAAPSSKPAVQPPVRSKPGSSSSAASVAPPAAAAAQHPATALKDRGNKLFQAGYYDDAIKCYTQSIDMQPTAIAYANRAMAQLKLNKHAEAERDCTAALQLDPAYVKALHRRGTARKQLGKLLDAAADFEEALRLEPSNKTVQGDRDDVMQLYLKQEKIQRSSNWSSIPVQVQQLEQQRLEELRPVAQPGGVVRASSSSSAPAPAAVAAGGGGASAAVASERVVPASVSANGLPHSSNGTAPIAAAPPPAAAAASTKPVVVPYTPNSSSSPEPVVKLASPHSAEQQQQQQQQSPSASAAAAAAAAQLAARRAASLRAPKTSHDFEAAWRSFRGDTQLQAKYLQLLSPQQLPAVFKSSLTAQMLAAILTVALRAAAAAAHGTAKHGSSSAAAAAAAAGDQGCSGASAVDGLEQGHAVALMEQMVKVPRFDMTIMCLTTKDKAVLKELWDAAAAACNLGLQGQLQGVRAKYRL